MVRAEYLFPRNLPELDIDAEAFSHAIRNIVTNSRPGDGQGRRALLGGDSSRTSSSPTGPIFRSRPGDYICLHIQDQGHGISEKALPARLRALLHHAQRLAGPRPHHRALLHPAHGRHDPARFDARRRHHRFHLSARAPAPAAARHRATPRDRLAATGTAALPAAPKPSNKRRILLMDDEQMILDIVSRMLGHLGYEVTTCTDGSQAIAAFAKAKSHGRAVRRRA